MKKWLLKYKLVHLFAWIAVSFFLLCTNYDYNAPFFPQLLGTMNATALAAPACYFAAYKLTPRYLYQKKIKAFVGCLFLLVVANAIVTYVIALFVYYLMTGLPMFRSASYIVSIGSVILFYDVMLISISCAVKIIADRFSMEQRLQEAEKERITTELNFLRAQVNPHFLFNVMNTIYFQIDKSNSPARSSIEKLSEMLRYQLYECTTDKIDINRELDYIRNYVAMQSLRLEKGTDIQLCVDAEFRHFAIAPLLLLPLVENAFKHVSHFKKAAENKIHISMKRDGDHFITHISNTFDTEQSKHLLQSGGLGIQNVRRRLDLLYPGAHQLTVERRQHTFTTTLKIKQYD